jgi:hypothetical protein
MPNAQIELNLLLRALHVGDRLSNRLEACLGEVGIEFARFCRLRQEGCARRLGIFGLNLNYGVERLGAYQIFDEYSAGIQRLFRIVSRFGDNS